MESTLIVLDLRGIIRVCYKNFFLKPAENASTLFPFRLGIKIIFLVLLECLPFLWRDLL